ncbi:MAG: metallophosphoesterase [Verrucomicrobiota bacterium]
MKLSRRKWLGRLAFYGTPFAAYGYGSLIEKRWIDLTRTEVPLAPQQAALDGLKIAVMGDFHHDDFGDDGLIRRAVRRINDEKVDLVMLVGDYISDDARALDPLCAALSDLRPRLRSFAVYGNHDRWHDHGRFSETLADAGITLLTNEAVEFDSFAVAGLDSYWGGLPNIDGTFNQVPPEKPVLLGLHEPDPFDLISDSRLALQVSGHTHGGQVCAPVFGPILLPQYGKQYPYGLYQREGRSLFVTRGIGTLSIPVRFFCAPEVAILTLRANAKA